MSDKFHLNSGSSSHTSSPYSKSDLPIDEQGRVYHLQIRPEQIAPDILIVGDPGRAEIIGSNFLRDIEVEHEHRGLITVTGISEITGEQATIISPLRTTVATSGMGTGSLEIVLGELVALNEIDFKTRTRKPEFPRLHIIRVGSSGALQASTKLGSVIITSYAIGIDNTGLFYEAPIPDETCERVEGELYQLIKGSMSNRSRFYGKIHPYVSRAEPMLVNALLDASVCLGIPTKLGLTVSCSGFFAPQGRDISRLKSSIPEIDKIFSAYDPKVGDQLVENMEMEGSFLLHYIGGIGYWGAEICAAISNRREETFDYQYQDTIRNATQVALMALAKIRKQYPEVRIQRGNG